MENKVLLFDDITLLFRETSNKLNDSNPMISSKEFSLYESMSAIEIMDPKMDPCYNVKGRRFKDIIQLNISLNYNINDILILLKELFIREI